MSNTPGNEFKNWDAPAGHDPKKNWNKVQKNTRNTLLSSKSALILLPESYAATIEAKKIRLKQIEE